MLRGIPNPALARNPALPICNAAVGSQEEALKQHALLARVPVAGGLGTTAAGSGSGTGAGAAASAGASLGISPGSAGAGMSPKAANVAAAASSPHDGAPTTCGADEGRPPAGLRLRLPGPCPGQGLGAPEAMPGNLAVDRRSQPAAPEPPLEPETLVGALFRGRLRSRVACCACPNTSVRRSIGSFEGLGVGELVGRRCSTGG
jgi:hypothetical protein